MLYRYRNIQEWKTVTTAVIAVMAIVLLAAPGAGAGESAGAESGPAEQFFGTGNYTGAVEFLEEYLRSGGDDPDAKMQLAAAYIHTGRHYEAVGLLEGIIEQEPGNAYARIWLARAKAELGRTDEAVEHIKNGVGIAPDNEKLLVFAGAVACETGDFVLAERYAYRVSGPDAAHPPAGGDSFMLLFFATLELDGPETAFEMFEVEDHWSAALNYCLRHRAADVFAGRGADYLDMAGELLDGSADHCNTCGIVSLKKGYIADIQGDCQVAAGHYRDAAEAACPDRPFEEGAGYADLLRINALRKNGEPADDILKMLDGVRDTYQGLPYFQWIYSITAFKAGRVDVATDYYLDSIRKMPANFMARPGPYTILTEDDYATLDEISIIAEENMDYYVIGCNRELDVRPGTFFTPTYRPGLQNLFRYIGPAEEENMCGLVVYSAASDDIVERVTRYEEQLTPLEISEDAYFIKKVYPSAYISNDYWYVPLFRIFPLLAEGY